MYQKGSIGFVVSLVGKTKLQARFTEQLRTAACQSAEQIHRLRVLHLFLVFNFPKVKQGSRRPQTPPPCVATWEVTLSTVGLQLVLLHTVYSSQAQGCV